METHLIDIEGKQQVEAIHHEAKSEKWIFFCHGFGSNKKGSYKERCEKANQEGYNAVRFDFRGNGDSDGEFINQDLSSRIKDLKTVIEFFHPQRYVLFGSSFGGKTVIQSLGMLNPEAVILRAPVLYNDTMNEYREIIEETGSFTHHGDKTIDKTFMQDYDTYSLDDIKGEVECPIKIFHGADDNTVKYSKTADASKELETDIEITKMENEIHSFSQKAEQEMREKVFQRLRDTL